MSTATVQSKVREIYGSAFAYFRQGEWQIVYCQLLLGHGATRYAAWVDAINVIKSKVAPK